MNLDAYRLFPRVQEARADLQLDLIPDLPLSDIDPEPLYQVRPLDPDHLAELERQIRSMGLLQPLLVTTHPTGAYGYAILDGHHRFAVLRKLAEEDPARFGAAPAVFLWTPNPNALYAVLAAGLVANATARTMDEADLPLYGLRYLARLLQDQDGEKLTHWLASLKEVPEVFVEKALSTSPVDPTPEDLPYPFSEPEFRAVLYALEAAVPDLPPHQALERALKVGWLLKAYPLERGRILGLPDPHYEADLRLVVRALIRGLVGPADLSRMASVRELATLVRLLEGKPIKAAPRPPQEAKPPAEPQVFVLPPLEAKPRVLKRAVRDLGRLLAKSARYLHARRLRQDPELVEAAERLYEAAVAFLRRAVPAQEAAETPQAPPPPPEPSIPQEAKKAEREVLASLPAEARQELLEEILREEGFSYE